MVFAPPFQTKGHPSRPVSRQSGLVSPRDKGLLYDGNNVLADLTDGNMTKFYVTPFLDQNLSMTVVGGPQAGIYYYSQDGLGSVRTLTDSAGDLTNHYDHDAFGVPLSLGTNEGVEQRYTYTGREASGVGGAPMYYRNRTNFNGLGRFGTRDPIEYQAGVNIYVYVLNAPLTATDPYGELDLKSLVISQLGYDHSWPLTPTPIPIGLGGGRLQVTLTLSGNLFKCCNTKTSTEEIWYRVSLSLEAYIIWGWSGEGKPWDGPGRDRNKRNADGVKNKNSTIPPPPVAGYRERNWHVDTDLVDTPPCPPEGFSGSVYVFVRGSAGVYYGLQGNVQQEVYPTFDTEGFSSQFTAARGVYGASVEVGAGGVVHMAGPMPGMN